MRPASCRSTGPVADVHLAYIRANLRWMPTSRDWEVTNKARARRFVSHSFGFAYALFVDLVNLRTIDSEVRSSTDRVTG